MNETPLRRIDNGSTRTVIVLTGVAAPDEAQSGMGIAIPCSDGRMWWPSVLKREEVPSLNGWHTHVMLAIALPSDPMLNAEVRYPAPMPDQFRSTLRDVGRSSALRRAGFGVKTLTTKRDVEAGQFVTAADVEPVECEHDRAINEYLHAQRAQPAPPTPCPSCDTARFLRKTDHGLHFCACGWHGASLTAPVVPRFAVGDWVRDVAYGDTGQVMFVGVPTHAACGVFYGLAVSDTDGEHRSHAHLEADLVATERPR